MSRSKDVIDGIQVIHFFMCVCLSSVWSSKLQQLTAFAELSYPACTALCHGFSLGLDTSLDINFLQFDHIQIIFNDIFKTFNI